MLQNATTTRPTGGRRDDGQRARARARRGRGPPQRRAGGPRRGAGLGVSPLPTWPGRPTPAPRSTGCSPRSWGCSASPTCRVLDARTPLLVADSQGVRIRLGRTWRGLPWGALATVSSTCRVAVCCVTAAWCCSRTTRACDQRAGPSRSSPEPAQREDVRRAVRRAAGPLDPGQRCRRRPHRRPRQLAGRAPRSSSSPSPRPPPTSCCGGRAGGARRRSRPRRTRRPRAGRGRRHRARRPRPVAARPAPGLAYGDRPDRQAGVSPPRPRGAPGRRARRRARRAAPSWIVASATPSPLREPATPSARRSGGRGHVEDDEPHRT